MSLVSRAFTGAIVVGSLVAAQAAEALTYSVMHSFVKDGTDGIIPYAGLMQDTNGNLWGTTEGGGTNGAGTVFEITAAGTYSVARNFGVGTDGTYPRATLIQDKNGNFWGTTFEGGTNGMGTVFEITAAGGYSVMHSFGAGTDGSYPQAGLMEDRNGNFWGTTSFGGTWHRANMGGGTVFEISAAGIYSVMHDFSGGKIASGGKDGLYPYAGLIQDANGNFWGAAAEGGAKNRGTVFEISSGGNYSVAHSFGSGTDGDFPLAGLIQDTTGNFWGTTSGFFHKSKPQTVFEITAGGSYSVVHAFGGRTDGLFPQSRLLQDATGNFWGTTHSGGVYGGGTVFEITAAGTYSVVHSFGKNTDGSAPVADLIQDTKGNLWGTTAAGGTNGYGTVFEFTP